MSWLTDPFAFGFMQRALVIGALTVVLTSVAGTWVVLRGLAFMGDALAHGVLPGITVAFLLDVNLVLGATAAALVMIGAISLIHRTTALSEDTAIGLLFVGMLSLGVIIISRSGSFAVDLVAILFGAPLAATRTDIVVQAIAAGVAVVTVLIFYRPLLTLAFDEKKAEILGLRPRFTHVLMMGLITLAVVTSFQTVGALLVFGLLIAPPATAVLIARRVPFVMVTAAMLGMVAVTGGLLASYYLDLAPGAAISALSVVLFFVTLAIRSLRHGGTALS